MLSESKETSRPYWIVPYSRNRTFTGRNSIIESVKGLCISKDHNRVALQGLGGCGKTQIALEYVYQGAQESGCHVFWTHGSGMLKFIQDFRTTGQCVHIPQASTQKDEEQFLLRIKAWFEGPGSGDWILVIDNADNEDDFLNNNSPIAKLVPQGNKGTVIFTTRSLKVARRQECTVIEVEKMAGEEARALFSKRFRNWDRLEDEEQKILLLREFSDIRREADVTESILSTYFITFERITKQMPTAAHLLRLIAFFDRQNIPEELLSQCGLEGIDDSIEFREAIGKLLGFSLVTDVKREGKRFYELHRLVQLSIRAYLSPEELDHWKLTALRVVSRLFPRDETEWRYGGIAAAYVPHALAVTKESTDSVAENLISLMGSYLSYIGFYGESEAMFHRALEGREKVLGPDHPGTLTIVNNLAFVLNDRGRYGESEAMFHRALEGREKVFGPDHPDTLANVNNLASVLQNLGRHGESEAMFHRALEGREKVFGPDHPDTLTSVNNLASVLQDLGRHGESEAMFHRALEGTEKKYDTLDIDGGTWLPVLQDLGRHGESEAMFHRALEGKEKVLGPDHPDTLASVNNLAVVLRALGRHGESEAMFHRALEGKEKVLGPDHLSPLTSLCNLAGVLEDQGKYDELGKIWRRVLEAREKALGQEHDEVYKILKRLAGLYEKQRKYFQAEEAYGRACTGFSKTLGEQHPTTLECIRKLTELRETKSTAERTSAIDAEVLDNDVNNRRSPHDRSRRFMRLRERRALGGGKSGKRR
ncbi:TPR-like protein [Choiromyces venosus 120613-1]|uniref:TPR-like protein n=1 Tax=Choiromyces venosus 120613-1 TaxID=1336337 RepID=A0A3N4JW69_9PEZI|nr:TPR-like protein [Choiromyces venosus 120613-1]